MPTLWKKNIYSYTNERMERRYVYRRYFGLMLLFGFPQETQLDKISPIVLVILIISMASPPRDAFFMPLRPRTLRLFSAFSPAGPKGCSKDDERVLKGCLCLCHPSQKLFFRRKLLHGTILFPKFSAKIQQIFEIYKDFSNKMQFFLYFVLQSLVICTTVRLYLRRIPYL